MIWTILAPDMVLAADQRSAGEGGPPPLVERSTGKRGERLLCRVDHRGVIVVERLIATDPRRYLDPRFVPGAEVEGARE
jgi:hypothetical protein